MKVYIVNCQWHNDGSYEDYSHGENLVKVNSSYDKAKKTILEYCHKKKEVSLKKERFMSELKYFNEDNETYESQFEFSISAKEWWEFETRDRCDNSFYEGLYITEMEVD